MGNVRVKRGRVCVFLMLAILCPTALAAARGGAAGKGRRQIATWMVLREEKGFDRMERYADMIDSLSQPGKLSGSGCESVEGAQRRRRR